MMHTENANKKLLWKTFLAITLAVAAATNTSAIELSEPEPSVIGSGFSGPEGFGGPGNVHLEGQGTLTAVFKNACSGDRQVGITTRLLTDGGTSYEEMSFNMSTPGQHSHSQEKLWLNCGERVTKTVKYDFPRWGDLQFKGVFSSVSYIDNWRNNQHFGTSVQYNWSADGTICNITYRGYMPPIADITCSKQ